MVLLKCSIKQFGHILSEGRGRKHVTVCVVFWCISVSVLFGSAACLFECPRFVAGNELRVTLRKQDGGCARRRAIDQEISPACDLQSTNPASRRANFVFDSF